MQLGAVHHLVRQPVVLARLERAVEDGAALGARVHAAGDVEQLLARERLELAPQLVRPPQQRDVGGMLPVGQPDDPGEPVRRAVLVQQVEALQAQHAEAAAREMEQRGAAHPAEAENDDVVCGHGCSRKLKSPQSNRGCYGARA